MRSIRQLVTDRRGRSHRIRVMLTWGLFCGWVGWTVGGCSEPPPTIPTQPVTGKILYRNGQPIAGAIVEFRALEDQTLNMSSFTEDDGSFELVTLYKQQNLPGAIEGPCRVSVTLPIVGGEVPRTLILPKPYVVRAEKNHFDITLDVPPR